MRSSPRAGGITPHAPRRRVDGLAVVFMVVFLPLASYAVFRLPFRFPPAGKIVSPSLVFGFNNAVAITCVVILIGFVTLFQLWRRSRAPGHPVPVQWFL